MDLIFGFRTKTYTKVLDVGEDLIIESKVIAGDNVDAGFLLDVPVLKTESLGLTEELGLGELASPVCFGCLLQVTVDSHARETEDRSVIDREVSIPQ
jgi:hypothetical protein